ncbi:terminase gpA endonuclease subunit, partial [Salmonella enterica]|uniref:terminase gpA endonuclease subunit n=1 Tax=Salmonella enterica TaxID=28901 RepID=UPI000AF0FFF7
DSTARSKIFSKSYPNNPGRSDRQARACGEVPLYLLQTNALKDRIASALDRKEPGANYVHIPAWLGGWFFEELTYEERGMDGRWAKPGKGANEALDLLC